MADDCSRQKNQCNGKGSPSSTIWNRDDVIECSPGRDEGYNSDAGLTALMIGIDLYMYGTCFLVLSHQHPLHTPLHPSQFTTTQCREITHTNTIPTLTQKQLPVQSSPVEYTSLIHSFIHTYANPSSLTLPAPSPSPPPKSSNPTPPRPFPRPTRLIPLLDHASIALYPPFLPPPTTRVGVCDCLAKPGNAWSGIAKCCNVGDVLFEGMNWRVLRMDRECVCGGSGVVVTGCVWLVVAMEYCVPA